MEFLLVFDWINENNPVYDTRVKFYPTKEELLAAKAKAEKNFSNAIREGRLILSPAVGYCWADFERLF